MKTGIVYTQGARFMAGGKPLRLRGLGVGTWLNLEHFMLGVPGWDGDIRACFSRGDPLFMRRFTEMFFAAEDAAYIRSLGVNFIRVPLNHRLFWNDEQDTENPYGFEQLERLASICEESGLYFLPDLHTAPSGQNPDWHSECATGTPLFWEYEAFQRRAAAIWGAIAARIGKYTSLLGYDLLNEPVLPEGKSESLQRFYRDAITAIRKVDSRHIVFLEGDRFSMDFSSVPPPDDGNWAYTYHFYPGVWDERLVDPALDDTKRRAAMTAALGDILASMGNYQGPLLCGELGYELHCLDADFGIRLTEETLRIIEQQESSWCLWCYKDARFMGLVYPAADSGWMRLVGDIGRKWDHHRAARLGSDMVDAIDSHCPYRLTDDEKYRMQFMVRAMVAHRDATHILQPALEALPAEARNALVEDFAFRRCEKNTALETLLKKICAPTGDL